MRPTVLRRFVIACACLLLAIWPGAGLAAPAHSVPGPVIGQPGPDVGLTKDTPMENAEGEVAAYPPGTICRGLDPAHTLIDVDGRLIFTSGQSQSIIVRDMKTGAQVVKPVASTMGLVPEGQVAPNSGKPGIVARNMLFGQDNQIVVLPNHYLLLVWAGWTATDLWTPSGKPHPAWWNVTDPATFDKAAGGSLGVKGMRGALFMWVSSNCGANWSKPRVFDSATVTVNDGSGISQHGYCAWPQQGQDDSGNALAGRWHTGGWDREQIYADPFTHRVYMSVGCTSGGFVQGLQQYYPPGSTPPGVDFTALFSSPSGLAWDWNGPGIPVRNAGLPTVMTSTEDGRLFLLSCVAYGSSAFPELSWSDDKGQSIAGQSFLQWKNYDMEPECTDLTKEEMPGHRLPNLFNPTISRGPASLLGFDQVRVAWMQRMGNQVGERVAMVSVFGGSQTYTVSTSLIGTVLAPHPHEYVYQGAFIEASGPETHGLDGTAVLYWLESYNGVTSARYSVFRGDDQWTVAGNLSVAPGVPLRYWYPTDWPGDYSYGAFYSTAGQLNYVAQWTEGPGVGQRDYIYYNTVTIPGT
jgi:hypothetical protein